MPAYKISGLKFFQTRQEIETPFLMRQVPSKTSNQTFACFVWLRNEPEMMTFQLHCIDVTLKSVTACTQALCAGIFSFGLVFQTMHMLSEYFLSALTTQPIFETIESLSLTDMKYYQSTFCHPVYNFTRTFALQITLNLVFTCQGIREVIFLWQSYLKLRLRKN